jgi:hypothetical protein
MHAKLPTYSSKNMPNMAVAGVFIAFIAINFIAK